MRAGLPLDRALEVLIGLADSPPAASLLQQIRDDVRGGKSLSQALDARRDVFSRFYVQHRARGRGRRRAWRVVLTRPRRHDGAQQGAARIGEVGAHLSDDPDRRRRDVGARCCWSGSSRSSSRRSRRPARRCRWPTLVVVFLGTTLKQWWWAGAAFVVLAVALGPPPAAQRPPCACAGTRARCAFR